MDLGGIPELIGSIASLIVAIFVAFVLMKLGWLIDGYREGLKKE